MSLTILGAIREILGSGSIFNFKVIPEDANGILLFVMPPGAFLALGLMIALVNHIKNRKKAAA